MESRIIIKANGNTIGAIQSLSYKCEDGKVSGDCSRTRFDIERITSVFSGGLVTIDSQLLPLNIIIFGMSDVIEVIENVWIKKIGATYSMAELIVVEPMDWSAERIYTF